MLRLCGEQLQTDNMVRCSLCQQTGSTKNRTLSTGFHQKSASNLQSVLDAVREVLECAERDGILRTGFVWPIRLSQVRHHHQGMTFGSQSASFQQRFLMLDTASVQIDPWAENNGWHHTHLGESNIMDKHTGGSLASTLSRAAAAASRPWKKV